VFTSMGVNFVALLASENLASYDTAQFYNSALALFAGSVIAALAFRVLPPLSPAVRTARLLTLTLRDLRRLARSPTSYRPADWERHVYARISALPDSAVPLQRAQIVAALAVGTEMTRLHRIARSLKAWRALEPALRSPCARPKCGGDRGAREVRPDIGRNALGGASAERLVLHARGNVLALSEVLTQYASYFDAECPNEVLGDQLVRCVCRAHFDIDSRCLDCDHSPAPGCGPIRTAELCLAPGAIRLCHLHDSALINRAPHCSLMPAMSDIKAKAKRERLPIGRARSRPT
jgi:hypothetical protein